MEKVKNQVNELQVLSDKLYHIYPQTCGSSLAVQSTSLYLLEILEYGNPNKIANVFKDFINNNLKFSYDEIIGIIDCIIFQCNEYIYLNNDFDLSKVTDNYLEFINIFNSYSFKYKMKKDINIQIDKLDKIQKEIISDAKKVNKRYEEINEKINKINYDLIGTISLFIGVIFAIYSGFELCTSVFEYVGTIEFKYLIIALIILGYIEISVISLLVHVIFKINNKNSKDIMIFNIMAFIIMIVAVILIMNLVK